MSTRIILVRHAEAEGNLYRRIHGWTDGDITEMGREQVKALEARFALRHIDAVYSSDMKRTMATAEALYVPRKLPLQLRRDLREVNMGLWEDKCWGWVANFDEKQYQALNRNPRAWTVPGCEAYDDTLRRMRGALLDIARQHPDKTVAVVSHGSAIRILLGDLLGYCPEELHHVLYCDNTAIAELTAEGETLKLHYYNDNSHLHSGISAFHRDTWWKNADGKDGRDLYFLPMELESPQGGMTYLRRYREAWIASHGSDLGFSAIYLDRAKLRAREEPGSVLEVYSEGEACGMLELALEQGSGAGFGHIALLHLEEEYRGRGLAVQLLGQAISVYRSMGRKALRLRVSEHNEAALRFYRRWGFTVADTEEDLLGSTYLMTRAL